MTDLADTGHVPRVRLVGPDVTRAVALMGVVVMNYHGYLNGRTAKHDRSLPERIFDPVEGPLTTRFAAVFVLVAGMGVTMLTNRSRLSGDRAAISEDRWRLARRGLLLFTFGLLVEWVWNGTILFFYGAYFMVAALLFTLRIRWLVVIGAVTTLAAAWIAWFRLERTLIGRSTAWMEPLVNSPRNLVLRTFVGYTHPLLPWMTFMCAGIILGRLLPRIGELRRRLIIGGLVLFCSTYLVNFIGLRWLTHGFTADTTSARRWRGLLSTGPFDRGVLFTVGTLGSALVAYCAISWLAERFPDAPLTQLFRHAGQMTLTLYLLHVLAFNAAVHRWHWVMGPGLGTALVFSLLFWVFAILIGALWHRFAGMGPLERVYRSFGG